uniref:Inner membrane protein n=1 Tax=Strongyloides stercoralis TaxID=6248 RepID=A0A0K0E1X2_STRER
MICENNNNLNDCSPMIKKEMCPNNLRNNIKEYSIKNYGTTKFSHSSIFTGHELDTYNYKVIQDSESEYLKNNKEELSYNQEEERKYYLNKNLKNHQKTSNTKVVSARNKNCCCSTPLLSKYYNMHHNNFINNPFPQNKYIESNSHMRTYTIKNYYCCCGNVHVVLGAKLFLVFYIGLTFLGIWYGAKSTAVWAFIPIFVISSSIYGFYKQRHKYIYPFLIVSIVQIIACFILSIVIVSFSIANYGTLHNIVATNKFIPLSKDDVTDTTVVVIVGLLVGFCCLMSLIHVWQCIVIYNCLEFFESINNNEWLNTYQNEVMFKTSNENTNPYQDSYNLDIINKNLIVEE